MCLSAGRCEPDCREVWICGIKIEFRGTGLEGVLQAAQAQLGAQPYRFARLKLP
jgi:hypothetical protein